METANVGMSQINSSKHITRLATLVAVLLVVAGGYWYYEARIASNPTVFNSPKGEIAAGFPKDILFESGIVPESSYQVDLGDGSVQSNVEYISKGSLQYNLALIHSSLVSNGWAVTHDGSIFEAPHVFFAAAKPNRQLNISFTQLLTGRVSVAMTHLQLK